MKREFHPMGKMKAPNSKRFLPLVLNYVGGVADSAGFSPVIRRHIELAVEEVCAGVLRNSFAPGEEGEYEIECRLGAAGLEIFIRDQGRPFYHSEISEYSPKEVNDESIQQIDSLGKFLASSLMDQVEFRNLGPKGKEIKIVKYYQGEAVGPLAEEAFTESTEDLKPEDFVFRPLKPTEAGEVSRCFYDCYGYTYINEHIYFPERFASLVESGEIFSVVAVTPSSQVASHAALLFSHDTPGIGELGMSVTKPKFRSQSLGKRVREALFQEVGSKIKGIYTNTVTVHPYTQALNHRYGFKECGLLLALSSTEQVSFKGIAENKRQRIAVDIFFKYLLPPTPAVIYPPLKHQEMIQKIYSNLGAPVTFATSNSPEIAEQTITDFTINPKMQVASLKIKQGGQDILSCLQRILHQVKREGLQMVKAMVNLSDPVTPFIVDSMEKVGFIFTGILPGSQEGDLILLQYFNGIVADYESVKLESDFAKDLLAYIRDNDPTYRGLENE